MFFSTSDTGACFKIVPTSFLYKIDGGGLRSIMTEVYHEYPHYGEKRKEWLFPPKPKTESKSRV